MHFKNGKKKRKSGHKGSSALSINDNIIKSNVMGWTLPHSNAQLKINNEGNLLGNLGGEPLKENLL